MDTNKECKHLFGGMDSEEEEKIEQSIKAINKVGNKTFDMEPSLHRLTVLQEEVDYW